MSSHDQLVDDTIGSSYGVPYSLLESVIRVRLGISKESSGDEWTPACAGVTQLDCKVGQQYHGS